MYDNPISGLVAQDTRSRAPAGSVEMEVEPYDDDDDNACRETALFRALVLDENGAGVTERTSSSPNTEPRSSDDDDPSHPSPHRTDVLYDAHADSEDEEWVTRNLICRPHHQPTHGDIPSPAPSFSSAEPRSDRRKKDTDYQLACPSCFALLCLQCQAHETYEGQFRALFVKNCITKVGETLRVGVVNEPARTDTDGKDAYRPVACKCCGTEVAVRDANDVYHFCNVVY